MTPAQILVVDDDPTLLTAMKMFLTRRGYAVTCCHSAEDAWRRFESRPDDYSAALIDMTLPRMSGEQLIAKLVGIKPSIALIACSGYHVDLAKLQSSKEQRITYLQKPFTPGRLVAAVERVCRL